MRDLTTVKIVFFVLGWVCGCVVLWIWFHTNKLIRNRDEYYKAISDQEQKGTEE